MSTLQPHGFPFEAVLWDMDGTLADSEPTQERSFAVAAQRLGLDLPDDFHEHILGTSDPESHTYLVEVCGMRQSLQEWLDLRFAIYLELLDDLQPFEDAFAIWTALDALAVPQGIVSNSDRMLVTANLKGIGLTRPGLITVSRNDVRDGKPAPDGYLRGAHLLGVDPARCAAVEDSVTGATAAAAAGMTVFTMPSLGDAGPGRALAELESLVADAKERAA